MNHPNRPSRRFLPALLLLLALTGCSGADNLPEGIFLRSVFNGSSLTNTILVFRDGQVAWNPAGDLEKLDFAVLKAATPKNVGEYEVKGGELTIRWGDGTTQTGVMKPDKAGGFDFRSDPHARVLPLPGGARLEGEYTGGASIAGASASVSYTFDGKGGYKANSAGVSVTTTAASAVTAGNAAEESGTYEVKGTRLRLKGPGGTREISLYCIPTSSDKSSPDMLLIGGVVMTRM